jgi:hypothetical protein
LIHELFENGNCKIIGWMRMGMGATFKHTKKTFQHIPKTLQHISLFNTFFNQNAKKKLYNTFLKIL